MNAELYLYARITRFISAKHFTFVVRLSGPSSCLVELLLMRVSVTSVLTFPKSRSVSILTSSKPFCDLEGGYSKVIVL